MGLAARFNSAQAPSTPQQQPAAQSGAVAQYGGGYPAVQQSWQQPGQQNASPQQGYQSQASQGYQPGYQQGSQQNYSQQQQSWQQPQSYQAQGYQPQGYQQQAQMQGAPQSGTNDPGILTVINNQLNNIIKVNRLEAFYPPQRLQQVQQHASRVDFRYAAASAQGRQLRPLSQLQMYVYVISAAFGSNTLFVQGAGNKMEHASGTSM